MYLRKTNRVKLDFVRQKHLMSQLPIMTVPNPINTEPKKPRGIVCFVAVSPVINLPLTSPTAKIQIPTRAAVYSSRLRNRSTFLSSSFVPPSTARPPARCRNPENIFKPRCTLLEENKKGAQLSPMRPAPQSWTDEINTGSVLEVWCKGEIRFAYVCSVSDKTMAVNLVEFSDTDGCNFCESKISFGEVISVWPKSITPSSPRMLASAIEMGLDFLRNSPPRSLDLSTTYKNMRRVSKGNPKTPHDSFQVALSQFPLHSTAPAKSYAAITAATGILIASDTTRFKRAAPGSGWRALPPSVVESRGRCSFTDICKVILENSSKEGIRRPTVWSREQLDILREIEMVAAGGGKAKGRASAALDSLGYRPTDDGATRLLLDLDFWSTGPADTAVKKNTQAKNRSEINLKKSEMPSKSIGDGSMSISLQTERQESQGWVFSPSILNDAREIRAVSREKRALLGREQKATKVSRRRCLLPTAGETAMRVYCIDDKNSRFLDDAFSVQILEGQERAKFFLHITDVDEVVKPGSAIDDLARERGMSLYLPLRPLHMLPAAVMDAASFCTNLATEAITIEIDFDLVSDSMLSWEVFPSLVPPVKRINYKQFDSVLMEDAMAADIGKDEFEDLRLIARIAPCLASKFDNHRMRRNRKATGNESDKTTELERNLMDSKSVASVRLVKRTDKSGSKAVRMAKVVDFQSHGAHRVVDDILTAAGALMRQFAKQNRVCLPEGRFAASYVARCGTAPLRRYSDLAIQRQIKSILFGSQPAGRRRMAELRVWLARRHSAGEITIAERRKDALFESLSAHCALQSSAAGKAFAELKAKVRDITVSKSSALKMDVTLEGSGLSTMVTVSGKLLTDILNLHQSSKNNGVDNIKRKENRLDRNRAILTTAKSILVPSKRVWVQILNIDTSARIITGTAFEIVKR